MLVLNRYLLEQYVHSKSVKLWLAIIRFNSKSLIMKIGPAVVVLSPCVAVMCD